VLADVCEGKITAAHARDAYGVVVQGRPPHVEVDAAATAELRGALRSARGPRA